MVGHVEWAQFAVVDRLPGEGEIVQASESFETAAGGGGVAAVQIANLTGSCLLITALGDDATGHAAKAALEALGVEVAAVFRERPQRRAFVHLDGAGERTITVTGERLAPRRDDRLPWSRLGELDGVYLTAGDPDAIRAARASRVLVASVRAAADLRAAAVELDLLLASDEDPGETYSPGDLIPEPLAVARTEGAAGGSASEGGAVFGWTGADPPGPVVDSYGAGDCFAGGVTVGLAGGRRLGEALELGARCGAACVTGRGPYEAQLRLGPQAGAEEARTGR